MPFAPARSCHFQGWSYDPRVPLWAVTAGVSTRLGPQGNGALLTSAQQTRGQSGVGWAAVTPGPSRAARPGSLGCWLLAGSVTQRTWVWPPTPCWQPRAILPPRGHFCLLQLGCPWHLGRGSAAAKHPPMPKTAPTPPPHKHTTGTDPAPNVSKAESEDPAVPSGQSDSFPGGWVLVGEPGAHCISSDHPASEVIEHHFPVPVGPSSPKPAKTQGEESSLDATSQWEECPEFVVP